MDSIYIFSYLEADSTKPFRKLLTDKRYSSKELGESYRVINHWTELGLLADHRADSSEWRKYSIVDVVWAHLIKELRKYGLSLEKLKTVRYNLFELPLASDWPEHELEYHIFLTMIRRSVVLMVYEDGMAILMANPDKQLNEYISESKHHNSFLVIDLNKIMNRIFPKNDYSPYFPQYAKLSQEEVDLINFIRFNSFDEVVVRMQDGKIQRFEGKRNESLELDLLSIIKKNQYQKIEVLVAGDKVVRITQTVKEKPSTHGKKPAN